MSEKIEHSDGDWFKAWDNYAKIKNYSRYVCAVDSPTPTETFRKPSVDEKMVIRVNKKTHEIFYQNEKSEDGSVDVVIQPKQLKP